MSEADKPKTRTAETPLPEPYDPHRKAGQPDGEGSPVDTDAPPSTDERGEPVELPNLGGKID